MLTVLVSSGAQSPQPPDRRNCTWLRSALMGLAEISRAVRARVPAKINLHLGVGPLRDDGYHDLITVFHAVSLHDDVVVRPARTLRVTVEGEGAGDVPTDRANLAWQAAELLAATAGVDPAVHVELRRAIPVAGGMAGGSADGAATLLACAALWELETTKPELAALAARLGSDVAFPLTGGTALGTGRGEQLTPVLTTGEFHWVLALAPFGISTSAAYAELDRLRAAGEAPDPIGAPDNQLDALRSGDPARLAPTLANDLQAAALSLQPSLADVLAAGVAGGALAGIVSGSGPTCAFLCADGAGARAVVESLASTVCRGTVTVTGPVHGARIAL
jgi:4-diphosphocytidyl-2-C-methyl-D-erythritol kinase